MRVWITMRYGSLPASRLAEAAFMEQALSLSISVRAMEIRIASLLESIGQRPDREAM